MDKKELMKTLYQNISDEYSDKKKIIRNESCVILYNLMDNYKLSLENIADMLGYDINVLKDVLNTKPYHSFFTDVDEKIKLLEKKIENGECDEIIKIFKLEREPEYLPKDMFNCLIDNESGNQIMYFLKTILPIQNTIRLMVNSRYKVAPFERRCVEYNMLLENYLKSRFNMEREELIRVISELQKIMYYRFIDLTNVELLNPHECSILENIYAQQIPGLIINWEGIKKGYYDNIDSPYKEIKPEIFYDLDTDILENNKSETKNCCCDNCQCHNNEEFEEETEDLNYIDLTYEDFLEKLKTLKQKSPDEICDMLKEKSQAIKDLCQKYGVNFDIENIASYLKNGGAILGAYVKDSKDFDDLKNFIKNIKY